MLSIPNEEAQIYQNRGIGETLITLSENRVTEKNTKIEREREKEQENRVSERNKKHTERKRLRKK